MTRWCGGSYAPLESGCGFLLSESVPAAESGIFRRPKTWHWPVSHSTQFIEADQSPFIWYIMLMGIPPLGWTRERVQRRPRWSRVGSKNVHSLLVTASVLFWLALPLGSHRRGQSSGRTWTQQFEG